MILVILSNSINGGFENFLELHLPNSLNFLNCGYNQITKIENLPNSLQKINCGDNKITKIVNYDNKNYNSIYRVGLANETFGIWKYNLNDYDKNLFIDTNITTNYRNALEINYKKPVNRSRILALLSLLEFYP